ncbi:MAG: TRAP transporter small permease subunit [Deltaproteobacteria bacterium]|nr:TRAP transporter small permease subunit [Deltaproteobacteria bacterium]
MTFKYIFQFIDFLERGLVILSFSLMVIFSFLNVILRALYTKFDFRPASVLLNNIEWSDPFSRMMLLWITFIGASLLTNKNRHIKIDMFGQFMSPFFISIREIIISIACMIICFFMFKASIGFISMEIAHGAGIILGLKSWIWSLIIPAGFLLLLLRFGINLVENIINIRKINKL